MSAKSETPPPDTFAEPPPISVIGHLRAILRVLLIILHVISGSIVMAFLIPWSRFQGKPTPPTSWWYRGVALIYGIRIQRLPGPDPVAPSLIVSNHHSWLDILVLAAATPTVFVSKAGVRQMPLIGWYAKQFGTIFLERGQHQAQSVGQAIAEGLQKNVSVVVFPEATTSRYSRPKKFFARLFSAAITAEVPVVPAAITYPNKTKAYLSRHALFVDDEPFNSSLWRVLAHPHTDVIVGFGEPIDSKGQPRNNLAKASHESVCQLLEQMIPDNRSQETAKNAQ